MRALTRNGEPRPRPQSPTCGPYLFDRAIGRPLIREVQTRDRLNPEGTPEPYPGRIVREKRNAAIGRDGEGLRLAIVDLLSVLDPVVLFGFRELRLDDPNLGRREVRDGGGRTRRQGVVLVDKQDFAAERRSNKAFEPCAQPNTIAECEQVDER